MSGFTNRRGTIKRWTEPIHDSPQLLAVCLARSINGVSNNVCAPSGATRGHGTAAAVRICALARVCVCLHICVPQRDTAGSSRPRVSARQPAPLSLPHCTSSPPPAIPPSYGHHYEGGESSRKTPLFPQLPLHQCRGERQVGGKKKVRC